MTNPTHAPADMLDAKGLLPCPFCGGPAELDNAAEPQFARRPTVTCSNEDCFGYMPSAYFARDVDAIAAWNRRASLPAGNEPVAAKPLKWHHFVALGNGSPEEWFAHKPEGGSLTVIFDKECDLPWVARPFPRKASNYATAEEAMAELEAEREQNIRSALASPLAPAEGRPVAWQSDKLGAWLSAALDDPMVADEYKQAINDWFAAGQPVSPLDWRSFLRLIDKHQYAYERVPAAWNAFVKLRNEVCAITPAEGETNGWNTDLTEVPRDRDFLIQFDHGEVTVGHYLDNSKTAWPWEGIRPVRSMRPNRVMEKIVAWREMPLPSRPTPSGEKGNG